MIYPFSVAGIIGAGGIDIGGHDGDIYGQLEGKVAGTVVVGANHGTMAHLILFHGIHFQLLFGIS